MGKVCEFPSLSLRVMIISIMMMMMQHFVYVQEFTMIVSSQDLPF